MRTASRLRKSADFRDVRKRGRRVSDGLMVFGVVPTDDDTTRFGLAVSKRVGGAVTRNRVKRRLRECLTSLDIVSGYNIVVSARPAAAQADYHMLLASVRRLAGRAGVLSPDAAGMAEDSQRSSTTPSTVTQSTGRRNTGRKKAV